MGFADWKKRSEAFKNVMVFSEVTERNIERACAAAYKAGEREGRKQAEAVAENGAKLAVILEREACAQLCDRYQDWAANWGLHENEAAATHGAKDCAAAIRKRSNAKVSGDGNEDRTD